MIVKEMILLECAAFLQSNQGELTAPNLAEYMGDNLNAPRVSKALWGVCKAGYLVKTKKGAKVTYKLSPKGREQIKGRERQSREQIKEWADGIKDPNIRRPKRGSKKRRGLKGSNKISKPAAEPEAAPAEPDRSYSHVANSAIDTISELIKRNEMLVATMRAMHSQLGQLLQECDSNE